MNIIVLDDNIHHQLRLESALYDVARSLHIHINIECARTIQALREYMNQEEVNQIYFLDLEIGNQKNLGFEIAKEIIKCGFLIFSIYLIFNTSISLGINLSNTINNNFNT